MTLVLHAVFLNTIVLINSKVQMSEVQRQVTNSKPSSLIKKFGHIFLPVYTNFQVTRNKIKRARRC